MQRERESNGLAEMSCVVLFDMHSNSWSIYLHETGGVRH